MAYGFNEEDLKDIEVSLSNNKFCSNIRNTILSVFYYLLPHLIKTRE